MILLTVALLAAAVTVVGVRSMRGYALARQLVDRPNARGAHQVTRPRGGGVGLVAGVLLGSAGLLWTDAIAIEVLAALFAGGLLVAGIGFIDDHGHVAARWRLLAHLLAAGFAVLALGPVTALPLPGGALDLGLLGWGLSLIAGVWLINLYNFMDGIDGLAAVELITVALAMALLAGAGTQTAALAAVAAASGAGFLYWNWPPARIFMGDVGSGFLGFLLGVMVLAAVASGELGLWSALILAGVFIVDATATLVVRGVTGARVTEAHSSHAYQHLARRFGHLRVTLGVALINLVWLLPLAALAREMPVYGLPVLLLAWAPLILLALMLGAGRPGGPSQDAAPGS